MVTRQAVFLVGGLGTRLGQLTNSIPKPLLSVANRPFLSYLIEVAIARGLNDFLFLAGHHGGQISKMHEDYEEIGRAFRTADARFRVSVEGAPAGTGGALLQAREYLASEFFLLNGDSLFDFNWLDLARIKSDSGWLGKIALRQISDTSRYGQVDLDGEIIRTFTARGSKSTGLINGGVYLLRRTILDHVSRSPMSLETEVLPPLAQAGKLYGRVFEGYFIDIGVPEDLARAEQELKASLRPR